MATATFVDKIVNADVKLHTNFLINTGASNGLILQFLVDLGELDAVKYMVCPCCSDSVSLHDVAKYYVHADPCLLAAQIIPGADPDVVLKQCAFTKRNCILFSLNTEHDINTVLRGMCDAYNSATSRIEFHVHITATFPNVSHFITSANSMAAINSACVDVFTPFESIGTEMVCHKMHNTRIIVPYNCVKKIEHFIQSQRLWKGLMLSFDPNTSQNNNEIGQDTPDDTIKCSTSSVSRHATHFVTDQDVPAGVDDSSVSPSVLQDTTLICNKNSAYSLLSTNIDINREQPVVLDHSSTDCLAKTSVIVKDLNVLSVMTQFTKETSDLSTDMASQALPSFILQAYGKDVVIVDKTIRSIKPFISQIDHLISCTNVMNTIRVRYTIVVDANTINSQIQGILGLITGRRVYLSIVDTGVQQQKKCNCFGRKN